MGGCRGILMHVLVRRMIRTCGDGEDDEMCDIELSKKAIGEKLDAAMACLNQVVKTERTSGLSIYILF